MSAAPVASPLLLLLLLALSSTAAAARPKKEFKCSNECVVSNCENGLGLRWGAYCGIGHGGCPGMEPCDAYDACCKEHDDCVGVNGMLNTECHTDLKTCLHGAKRRGEKPFSNQCSVDQIVTTMASGMDLGNMLINGLQNAGNQPAGGRKGNKKINGKRNKRRDDEL